MEFTQINSSLSPGKNSDIVSVLYYTIDEGFDKEADQMIRLYGRFAVALELRIVKARSKSGERAVFDN